MTANQTVRYGLVFLSGLLAGWCVAFAVAEAGQPAILMAMGSFAALWLAGTMRE